MIVPPGAQPKGQQTMASRGLGDCKTHGSDPRDRNLRIDEKDCIGGHGKK